MTGRRTLVGWAAVLVMTVLVGKAPHARADGAFKCAVEATQRQLSAPALCEAVGEALARPVQQVDDARRTRGDSLQVVQSDVQWIVIWLVDGRVRAWTRVSKLEAHAPQLQLLVSAAGALAKRAPAAGRPCVRLDPNGGHKMRSSELAYPWASLKPCKPLMIEVLDPWWLATDAGARGSRSGADASQ